jgi:hypothetical protein
MKVRLTLAALALGLGLTAAPARATDIHFEVRLAERAPACGQDEFGFAFDMAWPRGTLLGTGQSCVHETDDRCTPFRPFCHVTHDATFTLRFDRRGTVSAPMTLREVMPSPGVVLQRGKGRVAAATGEFAGARGRVEGGGVIEFSPSDIQTAVVYRVRLK